MKDFTKHILYGMKLNGEQIFTISQLAEMMLQQIKQ
jgi:hypothetical protein